MRHMPNSIFSDAVALPAAPRGRQGRRASVLAMVVAVLTLPRRVIANRRDMALLGAMSVRDLADIGLSRQDIIDAASLPPGQSPGLLLTTRADERRRARRGR